MSFAKRLKEALAEMQMSQMELAAQIGKSRSSVSEYVSGKYVPKKPLQEKIAEVLDCTVEFLNSTTERNVECEGVRNISVAEAAKRLDKPEQFVRRGLQQGTAPFGYAVMGRGQQYSYHISPKLLDEYIGGVEEGTINEFEIESSLNAG